MRVNNNRYDKVSNRFKERQKKHDSGARDVQSLLKSLKLQRKSYGEESDVVKDPSNLRTIFISAG